MRKNTEHKLEGGFAVLPQELEQLIAQGEEINIVDVRSAADFVEGHIPGAVCLPEDEWSDLSCLCKDRINIIYCYSSDCSLAKKAASRFAELGYPALELEGGWKRWIEQSFDVERGVMQPQHSWHQALL